MKTIISLLRGINVSGKNRIGKVDLIRVYESLNLTNVVTYIQSGNVIFDCSEQETDFLPSAIEGELKRLFGLTVRVLFRDEERMRQILSNNPFRNQIKENSEKLHVTFLSTRPTKTASDSLVVPVGIVDEFKVVDTEIYLFCPNGYGKTRLSNTFFETKLKVPATTRNWKTVNTLFTLASQR